MSAYSCDDKGVSESLHTNSHDPKKVANFLICSYNLNVGQRWSSNLVRKKDVPVDQKEGSSEASAYEQQRSSGQQDVPKLGEEPFS